MVRYAENSFENLVNKLVFIAIFVILITLILDLMAFVFESFSNPVAGFSMTLGIIINLIFLTDLLLIFRKRSSYKSFFKKNWLDIIAVLPFDVFRLAKVARLAKLARFTKVAKQGKILRFVPKVLYLRGAKVFSQETDFNKQVDRTRDRIFEMKLKRIDSEMNRLADEIKKVTD